MTQQPRFGLDPDDPRSEQLDQLYRERYGDPRQLEREKTKPLHRRRSDGERKEEQ